jgi:hypothetical protein
VRGATLAAWQFHHHGNGDSSITMALWSDFYQALIEAGELV